MERIQPPPRDSWFAPLSVDVLLRVLNVTIFHPFVAWIIPLCFRAEHHAFDTMPMRVTMAWATFITLLAFANLISHKIAYGMHREVDLNEEVIVITGGASGLGMLIAEVYGMRGATVAILDTADMDSTDARGITYYRCDVSDKTQLARVAAEIERDLGTPTILINNAAVVVGKSLLEMEPEDFERSISTNLTAHFHTIKRFLPGMIQNETGGTIVTLSSVLGQLGAAQLADYAAAKAGVTALHKSLAAELRQQGYPEIKTILVTPGQLSTPLFAGVKTPNSFLAPVVEPIEVAKEIIKAIDLGLSDHIAMPLYARWVDWYNVLPVGVQKVARRMAGVDRSMATFVGRRGTELREKNGSLI
ncbi:NAD(P)-binding protein [Xylariaceae sp. FL0016]|nr:NAD(P)-binding protein [Xylariaceae sp. FL0016]